VDRVSSTNQFITWFYMGNGCAFLFCFFFHSFSRVIHSSETHYSFARLLSCHVHDKQRHQNSRPSELPIHTWQATPHATNTSPSLSLLFLIQSKFFALCLIGFLKCLMNFSWYPLFSVPRNIFWFRGTYCKFRGTFLRKAIINNTLLSSLLAFYFNRFSNYLLTFE
jgi:hypothetical protein